MSNHLHAKVAEVEDSNFQQMVNELYHCVGWKRDDHEVPTIFYLLSHIGVQDPKALTKNHLPCTGILTTKVGKLKQGVVYDFCRELAALKHTHIESFDGKTVLSLVKSCFPWSKPTRNKKLSRNQARHERVTSLILQRRENGDL